MKTNMMYIWETLRRYAETNDLMKLYRITDLEAAAVVLLPVV